MYKFKWFSANVYDVNSNEYDKKFEISASDSIKNHIYSGLNKNGYISKITNINNLSFKKQWLIPYALIAVALIVIGFVLVYSFLAKRYAHLLIVPIYVNWQIF